MVLDLAALFAVDDLYACICLGCPDDFVLVASVVATVLWLCMHASIYLHARTSSYHSAGCTEAG